MSLQEVEDRYNKSITALKSLEQILKNLDASYEVHITRLSWLKHLADSCADLKRAEIESIRSSQIAAQVAAQQAAAQQAAAQQAAAQQVAAATKATEPGPRVEAAQQVAAPEEASKKTRKRAE